MRKLSAVAAVVLLVGTMGACQSDPLSPMADDSNEMTANQSVMPNDACWGQATKVFAQMGEMGEHASQQPEPRLGLRNLARALFDMGLIDDDTLAALGAFVADELGFEIDACM